MNTLPNLFGFSVLFQECHHIQPSLLQATTYCLAVSLAFVGSLYLLVPARVRQKDRDDSTQIQWRTFATATICVSAILVYPRCFCSTNEIAVSSESILERMGILVPDLAVWNLFGALAHSMVLYTGSLTMILVQARILSSSHDNSHSREATYLDALRAILFPPPQRKREIWISLRSYVIAPILEEIAFRGCMIPPLLATSQFYPNTVVWLAPIFFGLAHCHHALLKLQQGETISRVLLVTAFQFLYTTLFGVYCGHAFLRSRSILAVILSHSFCNKMGLPSLQFLSQNSLLYPYRVLLMTAHLVGVAAFAWGFQVEVFLPFIKRA